MAGKRKKREEDERLPASEYYRLNTQAVDDLVTADESNSPEVPQEELNRYRSRQRLHLGDTVKALLIKFWFNGAVCFFFFWGLGAYLADFLDQFVVLGIALGVITDLMVNNVFRFLEKTPGGNDRWMMFPRRSLASFFLNILYAFLLLFVVYMLYNGINGAIVRVTGAAGTVPLGVEPIFFGLFTLGADLLFLWMKHLFQRILEDAKQNLKDKP